MKSKLTMLFTAAALLVVFTFVACSSGGSNGGTLFPINSVPVFPTVPKFLVAIDGANSSATTNVNVFPINPTTGVLGAPVTGAPFDMGLVDAMTIAVHPNGHFFYVADGSNGTIHAWDVNETTGVPTQIANVTNASGTFYEPSGSGDSPTHVITVTPDGKYLYSANNDATVGAYSINATTGALTHISDLTTGACDTGAITARTDFVWVTDTCGGSGPWNVYTLKINADGSLTQTSSVALTSVFTWLWSIQVNPAANFLYVGDEGGNAQIYSFSIAADGSLTQLGPQLVENSSSDCRDIAHSPDGKFFYTTDDDEETHAFSVNTTNGAITELSASPYTLGGEGQVIVDLTGHFVYAADQENTGGVNTWTRDLTTGALTPIGTGVTASPNDAVIALGIVR